MIPFLFVWVGLWISWAATGALALNILWPTGPQAGTNVSVQFSGGTTPYVLFVNDKNTSEIVYTYTGNANVTWWEVNVDSGTVVTFQVTDETGLSVTSDPVTVLANAQSEVASVSSVSLQRLSSLSVSLQTASEASIASIVSLSSISITSFQVHATPTVTTSGTFTWTWTRTWSVEPGSTIHGSTPTSSSGSGGGGGGGGGNHTGAIVGGVVGGILGLALLAAAAFVLLKRRKYGVVPQSPSSSEAGGHPMTQTGAGGGAGTGLIGAGAATGAGAGAYAGSEHATGTTGPSSAQSYGGSSQQQQQYPGGYHPTTFAPGAVPAPRSPFSPSEHPMSMSMHTADTGPGTYPQTMYGSSGTGPSTFGQSSFPPQGSNSMQSPTGNRGQWSGLPEL